MTYKKLEQKNLQFDLLNRKSLGPGWRQLGKMEFKVSALAPPLPVWPTTLFQFLSADKPLS